MLFTFKKNTVVTFNLILEIISKIKFVVFWGYETPIKGPSLFPPMSKPCQISAMGRSPRSPQAAWGGPSLLP